MLSFYAVFTTEFWPIAANACHQKKLFTRCFTHFQYLSDKFILFWF